MNEFDISTSAIIKIVISGVFIYLIAPLLLIMRDMFILKIIEKFILTESLSFDIRMCESDRWYLNNNYQKQRKIKLPVSGVNKICELDGKEVSEEEYNNYESGLEMHRNRFQILDAKINSKHNLVFWLTKHYKQDGFESPIPKWREDAYKNAEKNNA